MAAAPAQIGSSEWRFSLLRQIYETFDLDGAFLALTTSDSRMLTLHCCRRGCRLHCRALVTRVDSSVAVGTVSECTTAGNTGIGGTRQGELQRRLTLSETRLLRHCIAWAMIPHTADLVPFQVSQDVFVRSYDRVLSRKADDFAQVATKFLSAARNVRGERLSLRRGLVQTGQPAVKQPMQVSTRVRN